MDAVEFSKLIAEEKAKKAQARRVKQQKRITAARNGAYKRKAKLAGVIK